MRPKKPIDNPPPIDILSGVIEQKDLERLLLENQECFKKLYNTQKLSNMAKEIADTANNKSPPSIHEICVNLQAEEKLLNIFKNHVIEDFRKCMEVAKEFAEIEKTFIKFLGDDFIAKSDTRSEHFQNIDSHIKNFSTCLGGESTLKNVQDLMKIKKNIPLLKQKLFNKVKEKLGGKEEMKDALIQKFGSGNGNRYYNFLEGEKKNVSGKELKEILTFATQAVDEKWADAGVVRQFSRQLYAEIEEFLNSVLKFLYTVEKSFGAGKNAQKVLKGRGPVKVNQSLNRV
jgi:hypothetical protein